MSIESTVKDILNQKGSVKVWGIGPDESVFNAIKEMALHNVGALLVFKKENVVGIITERDYARKIVIKDRSSRTTLVREIMDEPVFCVSPDDTAQGCLALMTEKRIRHLPVYDADALVGLISMGDVVNAVISDREFLIAQLTRYITDSYSSGDEVLKATRVF